MPFKKHRQLVGKFPDSSELFAAKLCNFLADNRPTRLMAVVFKRLSIGPAHFYFSIELFKLEFISDNIQTGIDTRISNSATFLNTSSVKRSSQIGDLRAGDWTPQSRTMRRDKSPGREIWLTISCVLCDENRSQQDMLLQFR